MVEIYDAHPPSSGYGGSLELNLPIGANFALFLKLSGFLFNNDMLVPHTSMTSANCNISNQMAQNGPYNAIPYAINGNDLTTLGSMNAWFCAVTSLNGNGKVQLDFSCDLIVPPPTDTFPSRKTYYFIWYA